MIIITFDDAVNDGNWDLYQKDIFPEKFKVSMLSNKYLYMNEWMNEWMKDLLLI